MKHLALFSSEGKSEKIKVSSAAIFVWQFKARFHVAVRTQINKFAFYFIVRRNVKFGCSEC